MWFIKYILKHSSLNSQSESIESNVLDLCVSQDWKTLFQFSPIFFLCQKPVRHLLLVGSWLKKKKNPYSISLAFSCIAPSTVVLVGSSGNGISSSIS